MSSLAELLPDLAREVGLDPFTLKSLANHPEFTIVTFQVGGAKKDLVGYVAPDYTQYGILDRHHKDRVFEGETWIVRIQKHHAIKVGFFIPVKRVDLDLLTAAEGGFTQALARELTEYHPDWLDALRPQPGPDPEAVTALEAQVAILQDQLAEAEQQRDTLRDVVIQYRDQLVGPLDRALAATGPPVLADPAPVSTRPVRARELPLYAVDANVFFHAKQEDNPVYKRIVEGAGTRYRLATTQRVKDELKANYLLPDDLVVLEAGDIPKSLHEMAAANVSLRGKPACENDLSLVQLAIQDPRIHGIITSDYGIHNMHPESIVREMAGRNIECLHPKEFVKQHRKFFRPSAGDEEE